MAGQQAAYGVLMTRHRDWVYRLIRSHIGDADEALDVTQISFVAAFSALARYDGSRSFRAWIARIAINKCRDWARRRAVRRLFAFAVPISEAEEIADSTVPIDDSLGAAQELDRAMRAIRMLPASLKEPLILRMIEDMSQAETARILGISEKAVEMRVYRARTKLSEILRG
ncbi:RNA polymerase sigma factor [Sphingomonas colocasiae]|uniref:RNA polymerase sigma factor n=2 Tax=Sphingomonas colocasiae TaxID=1848973 RepID=A0ABS7PK05_9SPHN|nr:RNA polymerase sigma factor [Sphingomonas colocasiae]MBY8821578.1 RNA polymerase sigma factor [Sphingomonas colocasiae]